MRGNQNQPTSLLPMKLNLRTATKSTSRTHGEWGGMNWIRQEKRLAIYLRDGLACAYCAVSVEDGAALSLDHIKPHSKGGSNDSTNLVTCCSRCNSSRSDRPMRTFAKAVATYINHGATAESITAGVEAKSARKLAPYLAQAKELIALRGSSAKALAAIS